MVVLDRAVSETNGTHAVEVVAPGEPVANRRPDGTFGPSNNANPTGRPKPLFTHAGLRLMRAGLVGDESGPAADLMAAMFEQAKAGDVAAARLFIETIQGKPQQAIEHSGGVGGVTKVIFEREVEECS